MSQLQNRFQNRGSRASNAQATKMTNLLTKIDDALQDGGAEFYNTASN